MDLAYSIEADQPDMSSGPTVAIVTDDPDLHDHLVGAVVAAGLVLEPEPCDAAVVLIDGRRAALVQEVRVLSQPLGTAAPPRCVVVTSAPLDGAAVVELVGAGMVGSVGASVSAAELRPTVSGLVPGARLDDALPEGRNGARAAIEQLLADREYTIVLQPVVELRGGHVLAVEALARFGGERPRPPAVWLGRADLAGMRSELEIALASAAINLLAEIPAPTQLAINVSAATLADERLLMLLETCDAHRVILELTDHRLIEDYEAIAEVAAVLRALGVAIAVDDSGVGLHSLALLAPLQPAYLSLDGTMVRGIDADPGRVALARALVSFATEIGATVVAERVETAAEAIALRDLGVRYAQGYLIAPPSELAALPAGPLPVPEEEAEAGPAVIRTFALPHRAEGDFHAAAQAVLAFVDAELPGGSAVVGQLDYKLGRFGVVATRGAVNRVIPPGTMLPIREALEYWMVKGRGPQLCPDIGADPVYGALTVTQSGGAASFIAVPLSLQDGTTFGSLSVFSARRNDFTTRDLAILRGLGDLLEGAASDETAGKDRAAVMRHLRRLAQTDTVTKLLNAPGFFEQLEATMHRPARAGSARFLLRLQIDDLESVASQYGRAVCDLMIKDVAGALLAVSQPMDVLGRTDHGGLAVILVARSSRADVESYLDAVAARLAEMTRKREIAPTIRVGCVDLAEPGDVAAAMAASEPGDQHLAQSAGPARPGMT